MLSSEELKKRLQKVLDAQGNLYTIADIARLCTEGLIQWWQDEDLVSLTQISDFPQKKILICVGTFGRWDENRARRLHDQITEFGRANGCELFITEGRKGWSKTLAPLGWKTTGNTYRIRL